MQHSPPGTHQEMGRNPMDFIHEIPAARPDAANRTPRIEKFLGSGFSLAIY